MDSDTIQPANKSAGGKPLRVLIVAYYWPPAGGPGVQRWLKFVKYLRDFNMEPIVYVPENPQYPIVDPAMEPDLPEGLTVLKQPIKEPYALAGLFSKRKTKKISSGIIPKKQSSVEKLLLWIRGNFFIPDARVLWVKPSVKFLKNYLSENPCDIVITTGPPHSLHLIGSGLKNSIGIKWIADFRDPWTTIGYHKKLKLTESSRKKHISLEKKVLQEADGILVTSPKTKKDLTKLTSKPIHVITNGFDNAVSACQQLDEKFSIAHIGSLLTERNPTILWETLSELLSENKELASSFQLVLAGTISESVLHSITSYGLDAYLNNLGYISHNKAIYLQQHSQVLLLVEIDSSETRSIIPGKLFEYMAAKRPVLAIGPRESDVEDLLQTTKCGKFFNYDQKQELKTTIIEWFNLYKQDNLNVQGVGIEQYSRKKRTELLAAMLHNLTE